MALKPVNQQENPGLAKLPTDVRNKMGYMREGGAVPKGMHRMPDGTVMKDSEHKGMKKGGVVKAAKRRGDGCITKGKTKGRMV